MIPELLTGAAASAALSGLTAWAVFGPRSGFFGPLVWRGEASGRPRVALTFDDGPHPESTPRVLDLLARHGVRATFFVIGQNAERWPGVVRRIVEEGHTVGNHSWSHAAWAGFRMTAYWEEEIRRTSRALEEVAGTATAWFRPPFAVKQWHMHRAVRRTGHTMITFTRRGMDGLRTTPGKIVARLAGARAGDILALHDGAVPWNPHDNGPTLEALPSLLEALHERGLAVAPMEELIGRAPYVRARAEAREELSRETA